MIESRRGFYKFLSLFSAACIAYMAIAHKVIEKIIRRRVIVVIMCLLLSGCASLTYQAPDGTKVIYMRVMTGSDTIKGTIKDASIESQGQKAIDPATLEAIINILGAVK
jgi:hypothetical protein